VTLINRTKNKLATQNLAIGTCVSMECPDIVECIIRNDFDFIWFDTEHSALNAENLAPLLQLTRQSSTTPIVRVPWNDQVLIKKVLDAGAMGAIVPWINTRAEAEMAVRATKYPPGGTRGFWPRWVAVANENMGEYVRTANEEILVVVQIESPQAVQNLEEIATTPGVDVCLVGTNDLTVAMGLIGEFGSPKIEAIIADIVLRCNNVGMQLGCIGLSQNAAPGFSKDFSL
jgi:2-keto-3-deoxy-L-rhamnonate aldolase RhmA